MKIDPKAILAVLDRCYYAFTFPMLDNGYVYLAATRLSLHRSERDWAMVIEVFGFSPRGGMPDVDIHTFASRLHNRNTQKDYINQQAYENYLAQHPHDEFRSFYPIQGGSWQDDEYVGLVAENAREVVIREQVVPLPMVEEYARHEIELTEPPRVQVFELCRYLADIQRELVLATSLERRVSVLPEMVQVLQLEEWHHPNVADNEEPPSTSETFRQLAKVLAKGDASLYRPSQPPNTHWLNWPEGGTL